MKQKNNKYVITAIVGLSAAFMMQMLWIVGGFQYTISKIKSDVNEKLEQALFTEAEQRACLYLKSIAVSPSNSDKPDITYFETELNKETKSNISLPKLKAILDKSLPSDYSIILYNNGKEHYYGGDNRAIQLSVKSAVFYTRTDQSQAIQIELTNPYSIFFEELGLLALASFLMLIITLLCIFKQVGIIRWQQNNAKMKKIMTYSMIHDIKTPLSTIRLGLGALDHERIANDSEKRTKYLQVISTETQHAYSLINRILTISKSQAGKLELKKVQVDMTSMLSKMEENFKVNRLKNVSFENHINCQYAFADEEYLKEIFYNLIDNSIKYSDGDVTIRISTDKVDKGVSIRVRDNGIGISKADQKVIFDKYERASAAKRTFKKKGAPGFELGLTYVFQVIDAHEGMIGVESELGRYTEFSIFLPDQKTDSLDANERV
jgi:two-component system, OmpR family, phosphate regulon sensor histidine kinase PhoR